MERDDDVIDRPAARDRRGRVRRYVGVVAGAVALLILGAAGGVLWSERHGGMRARPAAPNRDAQTPAASPDGRSMPGMPGMSASSGQAGAARAEEAVEVSLTPEAVERAGIKLAEAKTKYLSMRAMLEADHQKLERTQKLVALGAASRQELEEVTAVHTGHETEVAAARQRLLLLGLSAERVAKLETAPQVVSEVTVASPADGLVIARSVNSGQVITAGQEFTERAMTRPSAGDATVTSETTCGAVSSLATRSAERPSSKSRCRAAATSVSWPVWTAVTSSSSWRLAAPSATSFCVRSSF